MRIAFRNLEPERSQSEVKIPNRAKSSLPAGGVAMLRGPSPLPSRCAFGHPHEWPRAPCAPSRQRHELARDLPAMRVAPCLPRSRRSLERGRDGSSGSSRCAPPTRTTCGTLSRRHRASVRPRLRASSRPQLIVTGRRSHPSCLPRRARGYGSGTSICRARRSAPRCASRISRARGQCPCRRALHVEQRRRRV